MNVMSESGKTTSAIAIRSRRKWPRWLVWTGWSVLGVLVTVGVVSLATLWFGAVHGVELNPHTLARRSYSFYEIPLIRWQVRGIKREDMGSIVVDFLESEKYVPPAKGAPDVWHAVSGHRGMRTLPIGDADILVRYLEAQDSDDDHLWKKWSEHNPKLAKVLWPAVSRLAHAMMFVLTAAVGLSVVIALVGFSIEMSPQHMLAQPLTIFFWWAVASFCGGCGLAILYNGTWRNVP